MTGPRVLLAALLLSASAPAQAIVTATFSGTVNRLRDYTGEFGPASLGQSIVIQVTYDFYKNPENRAYEQGIIFVHYGAGPTAPATGNASLGGQAFQFTGTKNSLFQMFSVPQGQGVSVLVEDSLGEYAEKFFSVWVSAPHMFDVFNPRAAFSYRPDASSTAYGQLETASFDPVAQQGTFSAVHFRIDQVDFTNTGPVPEPGTWAMMIAGFGAIGSRVRRTRRPRQRALD